MPKGYEGPADRLAWYERVVAMNPEIVRKGVSMPYTSLNGHMFSFLDRSGTMALRLPTDSRQEFLDRYETSVAEQHGHPMKEYVVVPADLLERTEELAGWFARSVVWIRTLKPKPTRR